MLATVGCDPHRAGSAFRSRSLDTAWPAVPFQSPSPAGPAPPPKGHRSRRCRMGPETSWSSTPDAAALTVISGRTLLVGRTGRVRPLRLPPSLPRTENAMASAAPSGWYPLVAPSLCIVAGANSRCVRRRTACVAAGCRGQPAHRTTRPRPARPAQPVALATGIRCDVPRWARLGPRLIRAARCSTTRVDGARTVVRRRRPPRGSPERRMDCFDASTGWDDRKRTRPYQGAALANSTSSL